METAKDRIVFKTDTEGNILFAEGNAIFLQMKNEGQKERIGSFDLPNRRIVMNKEYYDFEPRFGGCYSFNQEVLQAAKRSDTVRLICPEGRFDIPIAQILLHGTPLVYPKSDLTRQLYINLSLIRKYPAPAGEI